MIDRLNFLSRYRHHILGGCLLLCSPLNAQVNPTPIIESVPPSSTLSGTPSVMNQPVVFASFESVEMERLRLAKESENIVREDAIYREQLLALQQKLARASLSALPADQVPIGILNDFRGFLSENAGNIDRSTEYYKLLTETLNDLIPKNPYSKDLTITEPNVVRAEEKLQKLFAFPEDEGISRNIMAQIAAVRGGVFETDQRRNELRTEFQTLEKRKKDLAWNISVASQPSLLTGGSSAGSKSIPVYQEELRQVDERLQELKLEGQGLTPTIQKATRELQFQQFIIELAFQQRYIHSLIAAGFFRLYSRNVTLSPEAYPKQPLDGGGNVGSPGNAATPGAGGGESSLVPVFNSVPALETFLMNRIADTAKSRSAIDNMLKAGQLSAAENLVRELVLTAKYQPELHTIPHPERQRILGFTDRIRHLSDSLNSRNYGEVRRIAEEIESMSTDPGMVDIKAFAEEHPKKALQLVRQAEVAMKLGDQKTMRSLMEAAASRAPLDPEVTAAMRKLEEEIIEGGELRSDLNRLLEAEDYQEIHRRRSDFARFSGSGADPETSQRLEKMLEKEASIQETLKKCDEFEARSSYPDVWISLSELSPELARDERIKERRNAAERRCEAFAAAYRNAKEQDEAGNSPMALAWYLTALADSPSATTKLRPRVEELGRQIAKD
jgi:hypothetical protein